MYLSFVDDTARYNGRPTPPPGLFTADMEAACQHIERVVNQELEKRSRFPLEWGGSGWRANVAAVNCYEDSKESVGFHSDQLTYLGPYPTIASLSLGMPSE
jgi:alkylated DNA repair dioxygenase AlkB